MNGSALPIEFTSGTPVGEDALLRLLMRYGLGPGEQAAIRAFGRIVNQDELAFDLLERFGLNDPGMDGLVEPLLRRFCAILAQVGAWDFTAPWAGCLVECWVECYLSGAVAEFPFLAIEALMASCQARLVGDKSSVSRLELDILAALGRLGWCLAGMLTEVSLEREQNYRQMAEEGDPVLGIPNRRRFLTLLSSLLGNLGPDQRLGLVVVDVEWGLSVEVLAIDERDQLRMALSDAMRSVLRPADILCALGENEWAVILTSLSNPAQVSLAGHKLVDACEVVRSNSFPELRGRFCAGGAWAPEHSREPLALEQAARAALVVARASGRLFDVYCADVAASAENDAGFEREVAWAMESQQFQLYLQPQVELPSRRVVGAEALLRWPQPDGRAVASTDILRVLERIGMMPDLSRWVIQQAAQILAALEREGCTIRISINLVADDLKDAELPLFIRQTCETWRVPSSRLCFELTEGGLVSSSDRVSARTLEALKEEGRLALDDFGTGYSSMDYLRRLPVAELKLDKSFVERVTLSPTDRSIVELMIRIAHTFGLEVVAEGVEDTATEDCLIEMGCNCAQGHLYAQAMPIDTFVAWWRASEAAQQQEAQRALG